MPSKFVPKSDQRLKREQINQYDVAFKEANDSVKDLAKTPNIIDAWTRAVIDQYKDCAVQIPESMKEANDEFRSNEGESESAIFHDQFQFTNNPADTVTIASIKQRVCERRLAITPQRYNKWLRAQRCTQKKVGTDRCWVGLQLISDKEEAPDHGY